MGIHILQMFEDELKEIRSTLITLSNHVEDELSLGLSVLLDNKVIEKSEIKSIDKQTNALRDSVLELCSKTLLRQHAVAGDLRAILAASRIAYSLERIGDYGKTTAKRSLKLEKPIQDDIKISFANMAKLTTASLENAIKAYETGDVELARITWKTDKEVNATYDNLFENIVNKIAEDKLYPKDYAHLLLIAKGLERVGDLIADICQEVYFMLTCEIITKK